ncbi:MAG: M56 family metallopeptidase [Algoriphagus sp.]|uniref:M56 family metallopeptidase n=1 Tax=Algoriphagus sp. TaxID=1872435 RepID=UPI002609401D|nr:M56 family metallopeptidase [Algoriphagus sp.]MDG1276284.1 M56 family metallopeptidase [Algoriphagus sp.]
MVYLFKSIVCLLVLLLAHRLLLQRETMHRFNRFFLLFSVVASFLIPLYTIEVAQERAAVPDEVVSEPTYFEATSQDFNQEQVSAAIPESQFNWEYLLLGIYTLISLLFLYRFVRNITILVNKIQRNVKINYRGQTLVLLKEDSLPFSFLKYIFLSESDLENGKFTDAVFEHERTHVVERHSWDNLFIEALLVIFWFHPGLHWAKLAIKLNHEFIADEVALRSTPLEKYESQLLAMMISEQRYDLVSSLNFSLTKKRFEMMKRKSMNSKSWIKILMVLPVLGALVYFFSEKVISPKSDDKKMSEVHIYPLDSEQSEKVYDLTVYLVSDGRFILNDVRSTNIYEMDELFEIIEQNAPTNPNIKVVIHEGNTFGDVEKAKSVFRDHGIKKLVWMDPDGDNKVEELGDNVYTIAFGLPFQMLTKAQYYSETKFQIKQSNGTIEEFSYGELSDNYKNDLPNPPGEIKKNKPSADLFESWKNGDEFALWIDGKVVPNSILEELEVSEIAHYTSSFVHSNARSEHFPQKYQVNIYSLSGFENTYGKYSDFGKKPLGGTITLGSMSTENNMSVSSISQVSESYIPNSSTFNKQAIAFQLQITNAGIFTQPSNQEIEALRTQFLALESIYFNLPMEERRKVQRVSFPYAKIEKNGQIRYKKFEFLTPEERNSLGC